MNLCEDIEVKTRGEQLSAWFLVILCIFHTNGSGSLLLAGPLSFTSLWFKFGLVWFFENRVCC